MQDDFAPTVPVINNNGDEAETLIRNYYAVHQAAEALGKALAKAFPHGRNWQTFGPVEGPNRCRQAATTHRLHMEKVDAVERYAQDTLSAIMQQVPEGKLNPILADILAEETASPPRLF